MSLPADPPVEKSTRARFVAAAWLCSLAWVLYLDRICISQALVPIKKDLGLNNSDMSLITIAFTLAYGIFEFPVGRLGDRIGARLVLIRIVLCWSVFTALTGAATGFYTLLAVRFLFGAGEAGAFPNAARVLTRWFPARERGRVQGLMLSASQIGGVAAPGLTSAMIQTIGWRWAFVVFGMLGVAWAIGFRIWFRDDPAKHPSVNAAELEKIQSDRAAVPSGHGPIPWGVVVRNSGLLVLGFIIMCSSFNSYFYYSWFSTYLQEGCGLKNEDAAPLTSIVLAGGATGVLTGGLLADRLLRTRNPVRSRRLFGIAAYSGAFAFLYAATTMADPTYLSCCLALSTLCVQLTLSTWWSSAIEQCGRYTGALFGLLNMVGMIGAMSSQLFVGQFAHFRRHLSGREQWDAIFYFYLVVLAAGGVGWAMYRKRPLPEPPSSEVK